MLKCNLQCISYMNFWFVVANAKITCSISLELDEVALIVRTYV